MASVKDAARRDDVEAILQLGLLSLYWELDDIDRLRTLVQYASGPNLMDSAGRLVALSRRAPMLAEKHRSPLSSGTRSTIPDRTEGRRRRPRSRGSRALAIWS